MANALIEELLLEMEDIAITKYERDLRAKRADRPIDQLFGELATAEGDAEADGDHEYNDDADDESDGTRRLFRQLNAVLEHPGNDHEDSDDSAETKRRIYENQGQDERYIKRDLIRRHNVLMIRVGYDSQTDDRYFWDLVNIMLSKTDNCMVIANNVDQNKHFVGQMTEKTTYLYNWIPVSLKGYLRKPFYCLRSWFIGMASYSYSVNFAPTIVFVDAHPLTTPLLKFCYDCPIVSFGFFEFMLNRNRFGILPNKATKATEIIRNFCLSRADELLVPSKATGFKFTEQRHNCPFTPTAFYPPCHGKGAMGLQHRSKHYLLIIGPWCNYSRMEFAFLACQRFYNHLLQTCFKSMFRFVFIGYMDESNWRANQYKIKLYRLFTGAARPFGDCIITFTNISQTELWEHYRNCVGVVNVTPCDFAWPVLEAIYFGKPVICVKNKFTEEVIQDGINGFVQERNVDEFATHINYMLMYALDQMPSFTARRIAKTFGHSGRKAVVDNLLLKYFPLTDKEKYD